MSDWKSRATKVEDESKSSTNDWKSRAVSADASIPSSNDDTGLLNTLVTQGAEGASLGFAPRIGGALSAAGRVAGIENLGGKIKDVGLSPGGPTLDWDKIVEAYEKTKGQLKGMQEHQQEEHPYISAGAQLGGAIINPLMGGSMSLAKATGLGALQGAGESKDLTSASALKDVGVGAGLGLGGGVVAEHVIAPAISKISESPTLQKALSFLSPDARKEAAEKWATRALGMKALPENIPAGKAALEANALPLTGGAEATQSAIQKALDEKMAQTGGKVAQAGEAVSKSETPIIEAYKAEVKRHQDAVKAFEKAAKEHQTKYMSLVESEVKKGIPLEDAMGIVKSNIEQPQLPGMQNLLQKSVETPEGPKIANQLGQTSMDIAPELPNLPNEPIAPKSPELPKPVLQQQDFLQNSNDLIDQHKAQLLSSESGQKTAQKIENELRPLIDELDKAGNDPVLLNNLKTKLSQSAKGVQQDIYKAGGASTDKPLADAYADLSNLVRDRVENLATQYSPGLGQEIKEGFGQVSGLIKAKDAAEKMVSKDANMNPIMNMSNMGTAALSSLFGLKTGGLTTAGKIAVEKLTGNPLERTAAAGIAKTLNLAPGKAIYELPDAALRELSGSLPKTLSNALNNALDTVDVNKKNAVLFSIVQNPNLRNLINQKLGIEK